MPAGPFTFTPLFTGFCVSEGLSGAGRGRVGQGTGIPGGGGGGSAYGRTGGIATVNGVGIGGNIGGDQDDGVPRQTMFTSGPALNIDYGKDAAFGGFGAGGLASATVANVKYDGGDGGYVPGIGDGGGGGGAGSRTLPGNAGGVPNGGAARTDGGGGGGDGGTGTGPGSNGLEPGGGSGGGSGNVGSPNPSNPGAEAIGCIVIWNQTDWPDYATPGSVPRRGAIPAYTNGTIPANWLDTSGNPKAARRAFIM